MIKNKSVEPSYKFRIGGNIRKWRNIREVKQKELASSLKLSEAAVSNIENDITNITITQLEEISQALDVTIEQLLCDPQEKFRKPGDGNPVSLSQHYQDSELVKAVIASMEKKDLQLQQVMQQFIQTINALIQQDSQGITVSRQT